MANTAFVCYKLIDDVVKRGGQEVSDRYIVKACLNRVVISNKQFTTNQLMLQTGIKSENRTIDNQLISQRQPKAFKKDQYMSKSLQKYKNIKKFINIPQKQHFSCKKIKHKKQLSTMTPQLDNNLKQKKKQENNFFIQLQDKATKQRHEISHQQQKIYDKMRAYILNKQTTAIQQQAEGKRYEEQKSIQYKKAHSNFKKQFSNQGSDHTYDTDGKFLVFPIKNKQKCINNVFPISLQAKVEGQQFSKKKKIINPEQFKIKTGTSFFAEEKIKANEKQSQQVRRNSPSNLQKNYNNNHKRQVSSVNYLEVKPGISFTETSSGQSVRGQIGTKSQYILLKQKKSCFSKFVTSDNRSKTDGFSTFKNQNRGKYNYKKQSGIICKTQSDFSQRFNFLATFSRRTKQSKQIGTIRDINQNLLDSLIDFK